MGRARREESIIVIGTECSCTVASCIVTAQGMFPIDFKSMIVTVAQQSHIFKAKDRASQR